MFIFPFIRHHLWLKTFLTSGLIREVAAHLWDDGDPRADIMKPQGMDAGAVNDDGALSSLYDAE